MPLDQVSNEAEYANVLPTAIRRQKERVEAMQRQLYEAPAEPAPPSIVDAAPANTTVVNDPPAAPAPEPTPAPTTVVAEPTIDWAQRYSTLQGKYNAETAHMRSEVMRLTGQVEALQQQLAAKPVEQDVPRQPAHVTKEDAETYGEDLVAASRRWAMAEVQPLIDSLRQELSAVRQDATTAKQSVQQTQEITKTQLCMANLDAMPDIGSTWRATNETQAFIEWCQQPDPFSGHVRLNMLRDAFVQGDANRVGNFFRAYTREHTATQVPATPAHTPDTGAGRPTLESLATPGRGPASPPSGAQADKRIWTNKDIATFYSDKARGAYANDPAMAERLERDLIAAPLEGRLR